MMLDMRRTFDEMVMQYSGPGRAQALLNNQFYQTVATSLAGTQEYMAMEKLGQLLRAGSLGSDRGGYPPVAQRAGLPGRTETAGQLHGQPTVAAAARTGPGHRAVGHRRNGVGYESAVDRMGSQMLGDVAAFVQSLEATFGGWREKADRTYALLKRRGTQFVWCRRPNPRVA